MTDISLKKEEAFEFIQDFTNFTFSIGYSYSAFEEKRHLVHISFMFWHINFAWCWHDYELKNIIHYSPDRSIKEIMPWKVKKCKICTKVKR